MSIITGSNRRCCKVEPGGRGEQRGSVLITSNRILVRDKEIMVLLVLAS